MRRNDFKILKAIYDKSEVCVKDVIPMVKRKYNDHRDFYGLILLVKENYLGYSHNTKENAPWDTWTMTLELQCYSQGEGTQRYESVKIPNTEEFGNNSFFYIETKGSIFFHDRIEKRWDRFLTPVISILSSIIVSWIVANFLSRK